MATAIGIPSDVPEAVMSGLKQWADAIPVRVLDDVAEPRAKGVVCQLGSPGTDPVRLANTISARITKAVTRWDDTEVAKFQQEFRRIVDVVEDAAFRAASRGEGVDAASRERLAQLIESRIAAQAATLRSIVGSADASRRLRSLVPRASGPNFKEAAGGLSHGTAE